ncbi:MAG: glycosyltransferase family 2 protein [Candidatus Roizmanbacteria bacterium]|nr:glycosyltransferase family 2 protein [Candidatus Roizmanbacteria bacterium]
MKNNNPIISVIVANYNGELFIKDCISSILKEKNDYELIVVDDYSTDNSVQVIKKLQTNYPNIHLIENSINLGAAKSRNIGAKKSRGEILFFLDCDTTTQKGWYTKIISFFKKYSDAGLAQAKILRTNTNSFDYAGDLINSLSFLSERAHGVEDRGQFDKVEPIFSLKGAAMITRNSIFQKVGGFDEEYGYYWEEPDFAWRVWLSGSKVYFVPQVVVFHEYVTKNKDFHYYARNDIIFKSSKNAIATQIKNLGAKNIGIILPIHVLSWFILACALLFKLDLWKSYSIFKGIVWNFIHLNSTLIKRKNIQNTRKISDKDLFQIVGKKQSVRYYFLKGISYILGKPY